MRAQLPNLPLNFLGNTLRALCLPDSPYRVGFASLLLAAMNATWPHAGHLLINVGAGAQTLSSFAGHTCLDEQTPPDVDVLIFEQYQPVRGSSTVREGGEVETLYWQLQNRTRRAAPLPLLLLNFFVFAEPQSAAAACVKNWGQTCGSACGAPGAFAHAASTARGPLLLEEQLEAMAQHYGWSTFSLRSYAASALRDGAHTALGLSECQFLGVLFADHIHPTLLAAWMLSDALVQHLVDAQAYFALDDDGGVEALAGDAGDGGAVRTRPLVLPPETLTLGARDAPRARACLAASALNVTAARDWPYREHDGALAHHVLTAGHNHTALKPGWVSAAPDAYLELALSEDALPAGVNARASLVFLRSYGSTMGAARLSCAAACACDGALLDGRCEQHVSLHETHAFSLRRNGTGDCVLRLAVDAPAANGTFKFKLLGLSIT